MRYRPTKPVLGPDYVPAIHTNIAKTFARIRKQQAEEKKRAEAEELERISKVRPMTRTA
jgi:hypothetical protein